jgi:glucose/mannose-6-phosphate isomerase
MDNLDDMTAIENIDHQHQRDLLGGFSDQCRQAIRLGLEVMLPEGGTPSAVVIAGMGGSAVGGDILRSYLSKEAPFPLSVNRGYRLPAFVDKNTLVFFVSYSGNTEETVSAYVHGRELGSRRICITSGGHLAELAREDSSPLVTIPNGQPPRTALGYLFIPMLLILGRLHLIQDQSLQVREVVSIIEALRDRFQPSVTEQGNQAKQLARMLWNRFPIIYTGHEPMAPVAYRWTTQLNENAKTLAHWNVVPEMNHNEIVGWGTPARFCPDAGVVFLRDRDEEIPIQKRIGLTSQTIEPMVGEIREVWSEGDSLLARIFSLIYRGDYVSYYLAILYGVDPTPVERIDLFKRRLAE